MEIYWPRYPKGLRSLRLINRHSLTPSIEDTYAFAATWGSVINGSPTYTVLNAVLTGGIQGTGAMPAKHGPARCARRRSNHYIPRRGDSTTEHTYKAGAGQYMFRVFERVRYVARDPRSFVKLDFSHFARASAKK